MTTEEEGCEFSLSLPQVRSIQTGSTSNNMNVKEDDQALAVLATEAGVLKLDEVANTILLVKPGDPIKEVMKNLTSASSEVLSKTYAFLTNLKEDDDDVTKFVKDGWAQMIFYRLKQLMPVGCKKCNEVYSNGRQEVPRVTCRVCGIGACKDCFPAEEALGKWFYLCGTCDSTVTKMMGEDALDAKYFRKKKQTKDKPATTLSQEESESERIEEDERMSEEEKDKDEVVEIKEDDFEEVRNKKRGFKANKRENKAENKEAEKENERKVPICYHFKKARCHHGMSGKQSYNGIPKCPFRHPMICQRLLRNGDRGKGGCKGKEAGCNDYHQVKMCFNSMNTKKCTHLNNCPNGYHIKGTVVVKDHDHPRSKSRESQDPHPPPPPGPTVAQPGALKKQPEVSSSKDIDSFLGQLLKQQQEMMHQAQQARQDQIQMQQQMMLLMARMHPMAEARTPSPMMGAVPTNLLGSHAFRT